MSASPPGGAAVPAAAPPNVRPIFAGLMLGMLLAALSQTIVSPAMPRIVAELGGMDHYSWIAVSSLLASTVVVPVVGKLSDLFGRKPFYVGGILLFLAASVIAGTAPNFATLIAARVVQGVGMGTMMPLSQAIIGDVVAPRDRGKYQGLMGAAFGVASVVGPLLGGWITDHLTWRWLFFVNLPVGLVALGFIVPFMHVPHAEREHTVDYAGFVTLSVGLTAVLLATVWGGTEYAWGSPQIVGLFAGGAAVLALFVWIETRAAEPVLPLRLWKSSIFTLSNVANMMVAMAMFGAIYYIPVFVQGVLGASVTQSGAILVPQSVAMIGTSIGTGLLISKTGRYKSLLLLGLVVMAAGFYLLTRMDGATSMDEVVRNMVVVGAGIGMAMQTYTLIVQNAVSQADMGVATATTQLFRSIGSTTGVAVLGTIMTSGMAREIPRHLPPGGVGAGGDEPLNAGALLDPAVTSRLAPEVLEGIREALALALHPVFVAALPFVAVAFLATLFIREIPLRRTVHAEPVEAGREILAGMNQAGAADGGPILGTPDPAYRSRAEFVGLVLGLLAEDEAPGPRTREILTRIGAGDEAAGRTRLDAVACALLRDCEAEPEGPPTGAYLPGGADPGEEFSRAVAERPVELVDKLRRIVREGRDGPVADLTPDDLGSLERIALIASAARLLDQRGNGSSA